MRYLSDEEYERYWVELGGTREAIVQALTKEVSALVLDVACGWGYYTFQLALNHPLGKIVAVDIIPSAFTNMRKELRKHQTYGNIELLLADATWMPLKDAVFDLSTSFLGMRDIYMTLGREGVKWSIGEMIRTLKKQGCISLAVTPPDLAETEELRIAVEVEGEVFGARSLPSTFYRDFFNENGIRLLSAKFYNTGQKMTSAQTKRELRDGIEIAREIYKRKVPNLEEVWKRYGPVIERHGYGMYSKITVLVGTKN